MTTTLTRESRAGLLARAELEELVDLADRCLADAGDPDVIVDPEAGMVVLTVREPIESVRFHLGEVLVTRCEVRHRGETGWAMLMGDAPAAALAAAVLDAEAEAAGPFASAVVELCARTEAAVAERDRAEWRAVQPTIVNFEELH